jgi:hypothetical protein
MPDRPKHRFSAYIHVILGIFLGFLALLPLWYESIRAERVEVMTNEWLGAWLWAAFVAVSFWYSWRRCSSEALNYYDGLLLTAAYMITGWMLFSYCFRYGVTFGAINNMRLPSFNG